MRPRCINFISSIKSHLELLVLQKEETSKILCPPGVGVVLLSKWLLWSFHDGKFTKNKNRDMKFILIRNINWTAFSAIWMIKGKKILCETQLNSLRKKKSVITRWELYKELSFLNVISWRDSFWVLEFQKYLNLISFFLLLF